MKQIKIHLDNLDILRDISFAISCVQDYRDTIDPTTADGTKEHDEVTTRISRLFTFYNQLVNYPSPKGSGLQVS